MTAVGTLPLRNPDDVVADVAKYELGTDDAHCVLGNMRYTIPADQKLFVAVFDDSGPVIGSTSFLDQDPTSATFGLEVQQSTILHTIRVEVMGYIADDGTDAAKAAAGRIAGAVGGLYSQQLQGQYRMRIGQVQQPVNTSDAEETARLVRYTVRIKVSVLHQVAKAPPAGADYFDKFNGAQTSGTALPPVISTQ